MFGTSAERSDVLKKETINAISGFGCSEEAYKTFGKGAFAIELQFLLFSFLVVVVVVPFKKANEGEI